ncbi:MAG: diguanylate cyclase [Aeromonas sobria]
MLHFFICLLLITVPSIGRAGKDAPSAFLQELQALEADFSYSEDYRQRVAQLVSQKDQHSSAIQSRIAQLQCDSWPANHISDYLQGIRFAERELGIIKGRKDLHSEAGLRLCRGWFRQRLGDIAKAKDDYDAALAMASQLGALPLQAKARSYLGTMLASQGDMLEALHHLKQAKALYDGIGLTRLSLRQQTLIANTYRRMGSYVQAEVLFDELLLSYRNSGDEGVLNDLRVYQGILYTKTGRDDKAIALLTLAESYFMAQQLWMEVSEVRLWWANSLLAQGRVDEALAKGDWLDLPLPDNEVEPILLAMRNLLRGAVMEHKGLYQQAVDYIELAVPTLTSEAHQEMLAKAYRIESSALKSLGRYQASLQKLERYIETYQQVELELQGHRRLQMLLEQDLAQQKQENERLQVRRKMQQQELVALEAARRWRMMAVVLGGGMLLVLLYQLQRGRTLRQLTLTDELTGIQNRRQVQLQAEALFLRAKSGHLNHLSVLIVDIDHFKRVNDRLGHLMGDKVLTEVARTISASLRGQDRVGRNGGEEFMVLLPGAPLAAAGEVAERIRLQVANLRVDGVPDTMPIRVSIGCAQYDLRDSELSRLVHRADMAMYRAKEKGRDRVELAS